LNYLENEKLKDKLNYALKEKELEVSIQEKDKEYLQQ
jgi:hypothetical protein